MPILYTYRDRTNSKNGNFKVQIDKLNEESYIEVDKGFAGKRPRAVCKITQNGIKAFEEYVDALKTYLDVERGT